MGKNLFRDKLMSGEVLIADGATGTNLQRRGLPRGTSSEAWLFEKPEEIIRLHKEFIQAGADIILTNTFGGSPLRLESADLSGKVHEVNREAVKLAKSASSGEETLIAGSIGPAGKLLKPYGPLEEAEVEGSFSTQAKVLDDAGVDLIVIETQFDLREARLAVRAARSVSDLPLVCSFSFDKGTRTMMGIRPAQLANEIGPLGVDMLGVNCGRSLDENLESLLELNSSTDLPLWFKPNAGIPKLDTSGVATYDLSAEEMGEHVKYWLDAGAKVVGGCCGTSALHLEYIARAVKGNNLG